MKANELRIGNLVQSIVNLGGSLAEKCRAYDDIFYVNKHFIFHDLYEKCTGIPLSEEWLLKFGFEITKAESRNIKHSYNGCINLNTYINWDNKERYYWLRYYQGGTTPKIQYVHQLQNLYFALTGEELKIKA